MSLAITEERVALKICEDQLKKYQNILERRELCITFKSIASGLGAYGVCVLCILFTPASIAVPLASLFGIGGPIFSMGSMAFILNPIQEQDRFCARILNMIQKIREALDTGDLLDTKDLIEDLGTQIPESTPSNIGEALQKLLSVLYIQEVSRRALKQTVQ